MLASAGPWTQMSCAQVVMPPLELLVAAVDVLVVAPEVAVAVAPDPVVAVAVEVPAPLVVLGAPPLPAEPEVPAPVVLAAEAEGPVPLPAVAVPFPLLLVVVVVPVSLMPVVELLFKSPPAPVNPPPSSLDEKRALPPQAKRKKEPRTKLARSDWVGMIQLV